MFIKVTTEHGLYTININNILAIRQWPNDTNKAIHKAILYLSQAVDNMNPIIAYEDYETIMSKIFRAQQQYNN